MRPLLPILFLMTLFLPVVAEETSLPDHVKVMVVRGGHSYDTPGFEKMCLALEGVKCDLVLTAHMEALSVAEIDEKYDAILFLNQNKKYPTEERNRKQYLNLTKRGIGMVFLQFTLSSQPEWDEFHDLVGGKWFLKKFEADPKKHSTYFPGLEAKIKILNTDHPVTKGLKDFSMTDAYYGNIYVAPSVTPLLGTDTPKVSKVIAWTHTYEKSKVVYVMPGFSDGSYQNKSYRKLLANSLTYVAAQEKVEGN